jgi:iron complex outermembrane receptor protein
VTQDTEGLYLHDSIEVTPSTLVALGWRSERARYSGEDVGSFAAAPVAQTQKERAWELGLRQRLAARWTGFARMGRSFRFVNAEEIYESDPFFTPQFQLLRPQHAHTREAGLEWQGGTARVRSALFRTDVSDEIHLDPFTTGVGNTNLPPSRRQGMEIDGALQFNRVRLSAAYAYTEARFVEGTFAGRTVPLVPRHKLNLGAAWDLAERTRLSAALNAVSEQVLDNDEPNTLGHRIPAYKVVDLKLAQRFRVATLSVAINNVFDEDYYTYAARSAFTPDRYVVYPLPGRTLSLAAEIALH